MYTHRVQYYETDKMGIVHHSNYIRWMEEARIYYLSHWGYPYDKLEAQGVMIPVVSVSCNYKKTTVFPEDVRIEAFLLDFNGVKLRLGYKMINANDELVFEGESLHCFLNSSNKPINIKKEIPEFYDTIIQVLG